MIKTEKNYASLYSLYVKIFYVVLVSIACFRLNISAVHNINAEFNSLDYAWQYAISRFFHEGVLWGHDVIFTYGPLGFLFVTIPFGYNALLALTFWCAVSVSACMIFSYTLFSKNMINISSRNDNILLSLILFYMGNYLTGRFYPEYVLSFLIICLLSICWVSDEIKFFIMASILCVFSMFMKFNSGASDFASVIMFAFLYVMSRGIKSIKYIPALIITPALFASCFLIYNPSLSELVYYVRGAYEISSGYITGMSRNLMPSAIMFYLFIAFVILLGLVLLLILKEFNFFRTKHEILYALTFGISIFVCFKHSFVAGQGHCFIFMPAIYIYTSVYVLFMEGELSVREGIRKFLLSSLCTVFCITLIISSLGFNTVNFTAVRFGQNKELNRFLSNLLTNPFAEFITNIKSLNIADKIHDERNLTLPDEFINQISGESTSIYPLEISLAYDFKNYKPMPVFQAYSAYTSWLDTQNAIFFKDDDTAPNFIVFSMWSGRFPLIECPATWLEIFRHYDIKLYDSASGSFLLERRKEREFKSRESLTRTYLRDEKIIIPETDNICIMNVNMNLNLTGKFMKMLYKIPAVLMTAEFEDGRVITKRVLPDTLKNDTIISQIILDDDDFIHFMNGDMNTGKVKSIKFTGDGLKYYSDEISVTFTELSE